MDDEQTTIRIAKIIANGHLAESIVRVLNRALSSVRVSLPGGGTAWAAFERKGRVTGGDSRETEADGKS